MTHLGYQIPNFTYPDGAGGRVGSAGLFDVVVQQAREADTSGFDTVMVMDHFYQLPFLGEPSDPMLECYSLLAALAQHTSTVRLSALVTGNTYRNPTLLAKTLATVDVVSGGRAQLGIGAGWFELEHESLGFEFGTFSDRFEKLEEALQIIGPMLRGERPTLDGEHYRVRDAICEPPPVGRIPIMIGAKGPRMLRLAALHADIWSWYVEERSDLEEFGPRLAALEAACLEVGRDPTTIGKSAGILVESTSVTGASDILGTPLRGSAEEIADGLRSFRSGGFTQVEVLLWPRTLPALDAMAPVLDLLDAD